MSDKKIFQATPEQKSKAMKYRIIAMILWIVAIGGEVYAILKLLSNEKLTWLIVSIVCILILAVVGNILWKKSNKIDPASEKEPVRFFIQNQLGAIMSILAFLPLVILIFTNKDLDKKSKGIAGAVGVIALVIASLTGIEFDPASIEKYTEEINAQSAVVKQINQNVDLVYWTTTAGNKYHIFEDCQHIRGRESVTSGTVKNSWESKGISELCKTCEKRATNE